MRIKSLHIAGFKTFADPVTMTFPGMHSAIVGPNGCGKSNVIDAIRWVLGESSAKHLRGESMQDVIFKGSDQRKNISRATVTLTFDNSEQSISGPYSQYQEISIKREIHIDGESHYFINNNNCRRRDIKELISGTGISPRSYAVIEQDMISKVALAKPEELRQYIEEAADISRYREKRRETEIKIRHTRENIERIADMEAQQIELLENLALQIKTTKRYRKLSVRLREQQQLKQVLKWREMQSTIHQQNTQTARIATTKQKFQAEILQINSQLTTLNQEYSECNQHSHILQGQFYQCVAELSKKEQILRAEKQKRQSSQQQLEQHTKKLQTLEQRQQQQLQQQSDGTKAEKKLHKESTKISIDILKREEQIQSTETEYQQWEQQYLLFLENDSGTQRQYEAVLPQVQYFEKHSAKLQQSKIDIVQSLKTTTSPSNVENALQQKTHRLELEHSKAQQDIKQYQIQSESTQETIALARQKHQQQQQQNQKLQAELKALQAMQIESNHAAKIKKLLDQGNINADQFLFKNIDIGIEYTDIISQVLGPMLQAISFDTENREQLLKLADYSVVIDGDSSPSKQTKSLPLTRLTDTIQQKKYPNILRNIWLARDQKIAFKYRQSLSDNAIILTSNGWIFGNNWFYHIEQSSQQSSILRRENRIGQLKLELEDMAPKLAQLQQELTLKERELQQYNQQKDQWQRLLEKAQKELYQTREQLQGFRTKSQAYHLKRQQQQQQLSQIKVEIQQTQDSLQEQKNKLCQLSESAESFIQKRLQWQREQKRHQSELNSLNQGMKQLRSRQFELQKQHSEAQLQQQNLSHSNNTTQQQIIDCQQHLEDIQSALKATQNIKQPSVDQDRLVQKRNKLEQQLKQQRQDIANYELRIKQLNGEHFQKQQELQKIGEQVQSQAIDNAKIETLSRQIEEEIDKETRQKLLQQVTDKDKVANTEALVEQLQQKIQNIGQVNLAAEQQHSLQQEKVGYIKLQIQDLNDSLNILEQAIIKIDAESKLRFQKTFQDLNIQFQKTFVELFNGGEASLKLTSTDLLHTGISLFARPPGKRMCPVTLLSGGEKTLTALSFIFAIFCLNPAPFCLLDEVDAPLDDVNVKQYNNFVKKMADKTQFIVVTHNKFTMTVADLLVGITMREGGVSKAVSVDLQQAYTYSK